MNRFIVSICVVSSAMGIGKYKAQYIPAIKTRAVLC